LEGDLHLERLLSGVHGFEFGGTDERAEASREEEDAHRVPWVAVVLQPPEKR
jgi:ABC-type cobalt transport system substrate-binding protein